EPIARRSCPKYLRRKDFERAHISHPREAANLTAAGVAKRLKYAGHPCQIGTNRRERPSRAKRTICWMRILRRAEHETSKDSELLLPVRQHDVGAVERYSRSVFAGHFDAKIEFGLAFVVEHFEKVLSRTRRNWLAAGKDFRRADGLLVLNRATADHD